MVNLEENLRGGGRSVVTRQGNVVYRPPSPWSHTVTALLRHLETVGYPYSPRVVGTGFDDRGRETVAYIEGAVHPQPWQDTAMPVIGVMLKDLHAATASFQIPQDAVWRPWFGRDLAGARPVIGHCDTGPWNIVATEGMPKAFIDWEEAGPVDAIFELAQACWLNAQLYDDDVAEKMKLGSALHRARQVRDLLDGYELPTKDRVGFCDELVKCALLDAASEAIEAGITEETTDAQSQWAITWRTRSAAWILRHRDILARAIMP